MEKFTGRVRVTGSNPVGGTGSISGSFVDPQTDVEDGEGRIVGGSVSMTARHDEQIEPNTEYDVVLTKVEPSGDASSEDAEPAQDGDAAEPEQPESD